MVLPTVSAVFGAVTAVLHPYCAAQFYGTKEPTAIILPDLRNLSSSERNSLVTGRYNLTSEYNLQMTTDVVGTFQLCILKNLRLFSKVSACLHISTAMQLQRYVVCSPGMRPDCLPGSIVEHYFGLSLWHRDESTVIYVVLDIESNTIIGKILTNPTTTLASIWYDVLHCPSYVHLNIFLIVCGLLFCICGVGALAFGGSWSGHLHCRLKR